MLAEHQDFTLPYISTSCLIGTFSYYNDKHKHTQMPECRNMCNPYKNTWLIFVYVILTSWYAVCPGFWLSAKHSLQCIVRAHCTDCVLGADLKSFSSAQMNEIQVCMQLCIHVACEWVVPCRHNLDAFTVSRSVGGFWLLLCYITCINLHQLDMRPYSYKYNLIILLIIFSYTYIIITLILSQRCLADKKFGYSLFRMYLPISNYESLYFM